MPHPFSAEPVEPLSTERLVLDPLDPAHAEEMVVVLDDPALHRYVGGRPLSLAELRQRYGHQARGRSADESQRWFNWIVRRRSGAAVGYVQATVEAASGVADVAWVIGTPFQGRGYAREAAAAMLSWLRDNGVSVVRAHIHPDNEASNRVARALGFVPTPAIADGEVRWESDLG